jgi:hypothetical protein
LWGHEAPPNKQSFVILDGSEHNDELKNKGKPDERKMEKGKAKRKAEFATLKKRADDLVKSNETLAAKQSEEKRL